MHPATRGHWCINGAIIRRRVPSSRRVWPYGVNWGAWEAAPARSRTWGGWQLSEYMYLRTMGASGEPASPRSPDMPGHSLALSTPSKRRDEESKFLQIGVQGGPPEQGFIHQVMPVPANLRK
jgi:hypothetical protein